MNRSAIEARIKGDLTAEDFEEMKAHIKGHTQDIEEQLESLSSERSTMEQIMSDAAVSVMNLAKTWLDADLARRQELQNALFPEGLRFSNQVLLFEPGNRTLMASVFRDVGCTGYGGRPRKLGWWALQDLNLGPMDYESTALTAELRAR